MKSYILACLSIFVLFFTQSAMAEEAMGAMPDDAAMQEAMALGMPGEAHKVLDRLAGNWTYTMTHKMAADAPEQVSEGTSVNEWILDGRFVRQKVTSTFDMNGQTINYEGIGTIGHDNAKGHYITSWMDNMNTGVMHGTAEYDVESKTIKETGTHFCPMRGKDIHFMSELKFIDDNHFSYKMFDTNEDGTTYKMMDIQYTRQK